jgi:hypothetical protein
MRKDWSHRLLLLLGKGRAFSEYRGRLLFLYTIPHFLVLMNVMLSN